MNEKTHQELTEVSLSDYEFYHRCVNGLPIRPEGSPIPYGSGPHIVKHFRKVIGLTNPKKILEIGLNLGWSSALWLNMSNADVCSIDISNRPETIEAGETLSSIYTNRFVFMIRDSRESFFFIKHNKFDLCFVDGGHFQENVENDIVLALALRVKFILFDDIYERYGPGVMPAINRFSHYLSLVADMDNLRLYKNRYYE